MRYFEAFPALAESLVIDSRLARPSDFEFRTSQRAPDFRYPAAVPAGKPKRATGSPAGMIPEISADMLTIGLVLLAAVLHASWNA
ncbi:MAG: hypothetical protein V3T64_00090, partial [Myxococcota bacterium]